MLVGCKSLNLAEVKRACTSEEALSAYTLDLVPKPLQHIPAVISNQKYLVALHVRGILSIPWKQRKQLCEALLCGARIKGVPNVLYDYHDILMAIDREAFARYLEEAVRRDVER